MVAQESTSLSAVGVTKRFGSVTALDRVDLDVAPGESVALVGESGSGKTTLLRTFNATVVPDGGEVRMGARRIDDLDPVSLRRSIGFVQQEGGLLPHWSVGRNAALVPWLRGDPDAEARGREALALAGLDPDRIGHRWPRELSGGQRQRVAIARALAHRPATVLLDEPFGALDAITRADLQETVRELIEALGTTTLLVTHDLHEAFLLADRIAVMHDGSIDQVATPDELRSRPATAYVRSLLTRARIRSPTPPARPGGS